MRYILILMVLAIGLWLSACTFHADPYAQQDVEFSLPLVEKDWATKPYVDPQSNQRFCVITSGRNGLKVILRQDNPNAPIAQAIKSTRSMRPGVLFSVRVNDHVYRTAEEFFPKQLTEPLLADLKIANKTFLEWRESGTGESRGGQTLMTNIINTKAFHRHYDECVKVLER